MIPEFGHFLLWLALGLSLMLGVVPLAGAQLQRPSWMALARPGAVWVMLLVAASYLALTAAFMRNDFSVLYVAQNSNTALPMAYKIAAVWGGHEGSLLLWILMLVGWMAAVAGFSPPASGSTAAVILRDHPTRLRSCRPWAGRCWSFGQRTAPRSRRA